MSYRPKGKHVRIDASAPRALGICDYTGFVFNRVDLIRQMEWRGNALVWTGFYVGKPYADVPNAQLILPILPPDPVPVREPRLPQGSYITWSQGQPQIWSQLQVYDWTSWSGSSDGVPALPENQRLQLLQQEVAPDSGNAIGGGNLPVQILSPSIRLKNLQEAHWGTS